MSKNVISYLKKKLSILAYVTQHVVLDVSIEARSLTQQQVNYCILRIMRHT